MPCASFVVQSSAGKCLVQALQYKVLGSALVQALKYKVVLGNTLCKHFSTKYYWEVLCASFVVQSSTGKCFLEAL